MADKYERYFINLLFEAKGYDRLKNMTGHLNSDLTRLNKNYHDLISTSTGIDTHFSKVQNRLINMSRDFASLNEKLMAVKSGGSATFTGKEQFMMRSPEHMVFMQRLEYIKSDFLNQLGRGLTSISGGILKVYAKTGLAALAGVSAVGGAVVGAGALGAYKLGSEIWQTRMNILPQQLALKGMFGQAEGAKQFQWALSGFMGGRAPFGLSDIVTGLIRTKAYEMPANQTNRIMTALSGASLAFNRPLENSVEMFADLLMGQFRERTKSYGINAEMMAAQSSGMSVQQFLKLPVAEQNRLALQNAGLINKGPGTWRVQPEERYGKFMESALGLLESRFSGVPKEFMSSILGQTKYLSKMKDIFFYEMGQPKPGSLMGYIESDFGKITDKVGSMYKSGQLSGYAEKGGKLLGGLYQKGKGILSDVFGGITQGDIEGLDFKKIFNSITEKAIPYVVKLVTFIVETGISVLGQVLSSETWDSIKTPLKNIASMIKTELADIWGELPWYGKAAIAVPAAAGAMNIAGRGLSLASGALSTVAMLRIAFPGITNTVAERFGKNWWGADKTYSGGDPTQYDLFKKMPKMGGQGGFGRTGTMIGLGGIVGLATLLGPSIADAAQDYFSGGTWKSYMGEQTGGFRQGMNPKSFDTRIKTNEYYEDKRYNSMASSLGSGLSALSKDMGVNMGLQALTAAMMAKMAGLNKVGGVLGTLGAIGGSYGLGYGIGELINSILYNEEKDDNVKRLTANKEDYINKVKGKFSNIRSFTEKSYNQEMSIQNLYSARDKILSGISPSDDEMKALSEGIAGNIGSRGFETNRNPFQDFAINTAEHLEEFKYRRMFSTNDWSASYYGRIRRDLMSENLPRKDPNIEGEQIGAVSISRGKSSFPSRFSFPHPGYRIYNLGSKAKHGVKTWGYKAPATESEDALMFGALGMMQPPVATSPFTGLSIAEPLPDGDPSGGVPRMSINGKNIDLNRFTKYKTETLSDRYKKEMANYEEYEKETLDLADAAASAALALKLLADQATKRESAAREKELAKTYNGGDTMMEF